MKPTLLILAAGLSSRYKLGLKQIDRFGPSGEILLDYAIYDAIKAGFGKVVFVIRRNMKDEFEKIIASKYNDKVDYCFSFQELDDLPVGYSCPEERKKPWGTAHAVWTAREHISEPFAVINADDFYGFDAYNQMAEFLSERFSSGQGKYAMVGYALNNTLSDHGFVSRGVCKITDGFLSDIVERTQIREEQGKIVYKDNASQSFSLAHDTAVSMNFWGFTPDIFKKFGNSFRSFLNNNIKDLKSEFFLPDWINEKIHLDEIKVKVISSLLQWIGVTYPEDKPIIISRLNYLAEKGYYPQKLF